MNFLSSVKYLFSNYSKAFTFILIIVLYAFVVVLTPYVSYIWIALCIVLALVLKRKARFSLMGKEVLIWSVLFAFFSFIGGCSVPGTSYVLFLIAPSIFFLAGSTIVDELQGDKDLIVTVLILSIIAISGLLWYYSIQDIAITGVAGGLLRQFEIEGVQTLSATLFGMFAAVSLCGAALFVSEDNPFITLRAWIFLIMCLLSLSATVHLVNRTGLVVFALSTIAVLGYRMRFGFFKLLLIIIAFIVIFYVTFGSSEEMQNIISTYEFREENTENTLAEGGGREWRWLDALGRVFYMPFGWFGMESQVGYNYVHNWWLDVGRMSGLLPFLLLVHITYKAFKTLFLLMRMENTVVVALLVGLNSCLFWSNLVEPTMEASPYIAFYIFFIWGIQDKYLKLCKRRYLYFK